MKISIDSPVETLLPITRAGYKKVVRPEPRSMLGTDIRAVIHECEKAIVKELGDHALTKSHARHLSMERCRKIGLNVSPIECDQDLQDRVLSVHHACMLTFSQTQAVKIIENHDGTAFIKVAAQVVMAGPGARLQKVNEEESEALVA